MNYTEIHTHKKGDYLETIHVWILKKPRKPTECGVWRDGERVKNANFIPEAREEKERKQ